MIVQYNWMNWLIEYESEEYPWWPNNPYYFWVPIYLNNYWKLEVRRAWFDTMFKKNTVEFNWYNDKQLEEIKESCRQFLLFCKKHWAFKEIAKYEDIVNNFNNYFLQDLG